MIRHGFGLHVSSETTAALPRAHPACVAGPPLPRPLRRRAAPRRPLPRGPRPHRHPHRPGCVLGRQQRYLCACERRGWGDGNALRPRDSEGRSYSCRESAASARGGAAGGTGEGPAGPSTRPQDHDAVGLSCLSMGKADGALSCGAAASLAAEFTAAMSARGAARVAGGFGSRSSACVGSRLGRCV